MCYYVDISNTAVKIDIYEPTEFLINFNISDDYKFCEVEYDAFACWYIPNNEQ